MTDHPSRSSHAPEAASRNRRLDVGPRHDLHALFVCTAAQVFEHLRDIKDPEHPNTLEELNVMAEKNILVDDEKGYVR